MITLENKKTLHKVLDKFKMEISSAQDVIDDRFGYNCMNLCFAYLNYLNDFFRNFKHNVNDHEYLNIIDILRMEDVVVEPHGDFNEQKNQLLSYIQKTKDQL